MGMSTSVLGFKPADEKFHKMKEIYLKCDELEISPPDEVEDYFDGYGVEGDGVRVDIKEMDCCSVYHGEVGNGYEVDITKLPKDVKIIRFYNSW